jgi:metal-responsive CopG/Arc/MetJ family transcriptional regulator
MKAIQITMDVRLLDRLDRDPEVRRLGRSAVLRKATEAYLRRRRAAAIATAYENAYARSPGLGREFERWEDEGVWPEA